MAASSTTLHVSTTTTTTLPAASPTLCAPAPLSGCRTAASQRAQLVWRAGRSAALSWTIENGGRVATHELPTPALPARGLRLCVYDAATATGPILGMGVAGADTCGPKSCWTQTTVGMRYRNAAGTPDGITEIRMRGRNGLLIASLRAHGSRLATPSHTMGLPVRVQLVLGDAAQPLCWESTFATAVRNAATSVRLSQQP